MVSSLNFSIPKYAHCPLKLVDNLVTHATHPSEARCHDLVGFTISLKCFPRSNYVVDSNGKGKGGREVDISPMECAVLDLSKGRTKL